MNAPAAPFLGCPSAAALVPLAPLAPEPVPAAPRPLQALPPPLVWLPADHRLLGRSAMPYHVLGDKYARAVQQGAQAQPVLFPLAAAGQVEPLLALVDGVLLTGSPSNVDPLHFGQAVHDPSLPLDAQRDALTLALARACVAHGVPLLGICRGLQELNVALGGSLHQTVHEVDGLHDHRDPDDMPIEQQYAPRHAVRLQPGSALAQWAQAERVQVNTLHGQGIDRLADALEPLAWADDGLIEAVAVRGAPAFAYAVQWHPEWRCLDTPFYAATFAAFGQAVRQRQQQRLGRVGAAAVSATVALQA